MKTKIFHSLLAGLAAPLAGCYAPLPAYPPSWPPPATTQDACASIAGVYSNKGQADDAEQLPRNPPYLTYYLFEPARGLAGADRVELAPAAGGALSARALRGSALAQETRRTVEKSAEECFLSAPGISRTISLRKAADGSLVLHIAAQSMAYVLIPPFYAEARWARFPPAP